jgi:hypothetical protein
MRTLPKKWLFGTVLVLFGVSLGIETLTFTHAREEYYIWHSSLAMISDDSLGANLVLSRGVSGNTLTVGTQQPGDLQWLHLPLVLPSDVTITMVRLCYSVSNPNSFISQVRLSTETEPPSALVVHDDDTDLTSTTPTCADSMVSSLQPEGALTLSLRLNFVNTTDTIDIGAIALVVER